MRYKKLAALLTAAAITVLLAGSVTVFAQGNSTTVSLQVEDNSNYTMTIPASTKVSDYGWTELAGNLKVQGSLSNGKQVEVTITSKNNFEFVNDDKPKSIAYTLKQSEEGNEVSSLVFQSSDLGDTGKTLGVYVGQDAWNAVPGGSYSDVLTFAAQTVNAGN